MVQLVTGDSTETSSAGELLSQNIYWWFYETSSAGELLRQTIYWWFYWDKFSGELLRQTVYWWFYWDKFSGELLRQTIYWPLQQNRDATLASLSMILPLCLLLIFLWPVADTTVVYLWCFRNNITVAGWWCCSARSCQFDTIVTTRWYYHGSLVSLLWSIYLKRPFSTAPVANCL